SRPAGGRSAEADGLPARPQGGAPPRPAPEAQGRGLGCAALAALWRMIARDTPSLAQNSPARRQRGSNEPFGGAEMTKSMPPSVRHVKAGAGPETSLYE